MKEKISSIAYLSLFSILFIFVIIGFLRIVITFSIDDGAFIFISVMSPSLIASSFLGFYFVKAILRTVKAFKKVVVVPNNK
jgi:hypothetical protein